MDIKDLSFSDVAGFYINCDPPVKSRYDGNDVFLVEVRQDQVLWQFVDPSLQDFPIDEDLIPCLRDLQDITAEELREIYLHSFEEEWTDGYNKFKARESDIREWNGLKSSARVTKGYYFGSMTPSAIIHYSPCPIGNSGSITVPLWRFKQRLLLINRRFDVFELIRNNKAVREGVSHE